MKAREDQEKLLEGFERAKKNKALAVPTDDIKVRLKLREFGVPQCFFGEGVFTSIL